MAWLSNRAGDEVAVDHLIRFEDLDVGMAEVTGSLHLSPGSLPQLLPHVNVSRSHPPSSSLSEASRARIHARYRLDYELLGDWR